MRIKLVGPSTKHHKLFPRFSALDSQYPIFICHWAQKQKAEQCDDDARVSLLDSCDENILD